MQEPFTTAVSARMRLDAGHPGGYSDRATAARTIEATWSKPDGAFAATGIYATCEVGSPSTGKNQPGHLLQAAAARPWG